MTNEQREELRKIYKKLNANIKRDNTKLINFFNENIDKFKDDEAKNIFITEIQKIINSCEILSSLVTIPQNKQTRRYKCLKHKKLS